mmetsp:Transcript_12600/g.23978  ORF Transcript_12600/g.23978 Transcript_12600/m.23978 type:complete len:432 (-) Transcript_12600:49-1344(-)
MGHSFGTYENMTLDQADHVTLPNNLTNTTSGDDDPVLTPAEAVYYVISIAILALFCFCSRSRVPDERFREAAIERRARWLEREERKKRMSDPNYRINLILKGLVIKKIMEEKDGFLTLGDYEITEGGGGNGDEDDHSSGGGNLSIDSMDEKTSTCAICIEPFGVGDVVGLSRTILEPNQEGACNHAFHKDCIVAWLINPLHDDCPSCRSPIVQEDKEDAEQAEKNDDEENGSNDAILKNGTDHHAGWVFVIIRGLVSRVRHGSFSVMGQSISVKDHDDIETGRLVPDTPPSPLRRVFSLEGIEHPRQRPCTLRRRTSFGADPASTTTEVTIPESLDDSPSPGTPWDLRRVVSDFTGRPSRSITSMLENTRGPHFPLAFRPRPVEVSDLSPFDISECSEDPIIIQRGLRRGPGNAALGRDGTEDFIFRHELS